MKKLISVLLAVMILGVLACAASADEVPQTEAGKKFESDWAIPGGLVEIDYEEVGYRVMVEIAKDDGTGATWEYSCYYHEDTDCLSSVSSSRTNFKINPDNGEKVIGETVYEGIDEEKGTEFTIDKDGFLIWKDGHDDAGAGLKFANIGRFKGVWKNEAAEVEVKFLWNGAVEDEMFYNVYITRGKTDADTYASFLMTGNYDPATCKLSADGTCTVFKKNDKGEYDTSDDGETYDAFFSKTADGKVLFETENGIDLEYDLLAAD